MRAITHTCIVCRGDLGGTVGHCSVDACKSVAVLLSVVDGSRQRSQLGVFRMKKHAGGIRTHLTTREKAHCILRVLFPLVQRRQGIAELLCVACGFHFSSHVGVCLAALCCREGTRDDQNNSSSRGAGRNAPPSRLTFSCAFAKKRCNSRYVSNCILCGAVPFCLVAPWVRSRWCD